MYLNMFSKMYFLHVYSEDTRTVNECLMGYF